VLPDPRILVSDADLEGQVAFALSVRDDITRLTRLERQLCSVREQLAARNDLLKGNAKAEQIIKDSVALIGKLDALEAQMQNPKAEVVYDILAMRGGAKLYSRLSALFSAVKEPDGLPTQGVREVYAAQKQELDRYESELKRLLSTDLATLNETARKLDFPYILVTAPVF
jgi:hypothetical protein